MRRRSNLQVRRNGGAAAITRSSPLSDVSRRGHHAQHLSVSHRQTSSHTLARQDVSDDCCAKTHLSGLADCDTVYDRRARPDPGIRANTHVSVHNGPVTDEYPVPQHAVVGDERAVPHSASLAELRALPEQAPRDHGVGEDLATRTDFSHPGVYQLDRIAMPVTRLETCGANYGSRVDDRAFTQDRASEYARVGSNDYPSADDDVLLVYPTPRV